MKAIIKIERVPDPKVNLYRLSYPGQGPQPILYHDVVLRGTTSLTLSLADGSSKKGMEFPDAPPLSPGETFETNNWQGVVCHDEQWVPVG